MLISTGFPAAAGVTFAQTVITAANSKNKVILVLLANVIPPLFLLVHEKSVDFNVIQVIVKVGYTLSLDTPPI